MRRLRFQRIVLLTGLAALTVLYHSDRKMFRRPEQWVAQAAETLSRKLVEQHQIVFLMTFDEPTPLEWVSRTPVNLPGVTVAPGRQGTGRRFDGHQRTGIETRTEWTQVGPRFTIAAWIKLDDASPHQDILFSSAHRGQVGLRLEDGRMTFQVPPRDQSIAYPFEQFNRFVHLAAVADPDQGRAFLYENGQLKASGPIGAVGQPNHNIEFGKTRWYALRDPLMGVVDETAIWRRALTATEIGQLYRARRGLLPHLANREYRVWRGALRLQNTIFAVLKTVDYFNPFLHPGRMNDPTLPALQLGLSKGDLRYFEQSHRDSRRNGQLIRTAARTRRISYVHQGRAATGRLRLHPGKSCYPSRARMAFELELAPDDTILGAQTLLLSPPERMDFLQPRLEARLAEALGLPHVRNGLYRLIVNGSFRGLYYVEAYDRMGVFPGMASHVFLGPQHPHDWGSLFPDDDDAPPAPRRLPLPERLPLTEAELLALYDQVSETYRPWLIHDFTHPLGAREIRYRLKQYRARLPHHWRTAPETWSAVRRAGEALDAGMVLGSNPSPFYLVGDLDLETLRLPGVRIDWHSSAPEVLSDRGRVVRPSGTRPLEVLLRAVITDARPVAAAAAPAVSGTVGDPPDASPRAAFEKRLSFRVMPEDIRMPAVMLYANRQLNKTARVDSRILYYPPGTNRVPRAFSALGATRGGLAHRGGSSYWKTKKPFSLRLDTAHRLLDDSATRHLYFASGYTDATFMRNRLSYDLFRRFSRPDAPRHAPVVRWAEVFVNGHYHGLYEMGTRVQRRMLGYPPYDPAAARYAELYKVMSVNMGFASHAPGSIIQKLPQRRWGYFADGYFDLLRFLDGADADRRVAEAGDWIQLENAVDFHLFLNFSEGRDNLDANFYLARGAEPDARFEFVLFDCDQMFELGGDRWFVHPLIRPLERVPAFRDRLVARWNTLREGPAHPDVLVGQIDEMEDLLADYMPWEDALWPEGRERPFETRVAELRNLVRARYRFLDAEMARRRPPRDAPASRPAATTTTGAAGGGDSQ